MEEKSKKRLLILLAVVCFLVAALVAFRGHRQGGRDLAVFKGRMMLLKCDNGTCGHLLEVDKKGYFEYQETNLDPESLTAPPFPCPVCGRNSCYRAVRCQECGEVFFYGTVEGTSRDTCPKCGFSEEKARRD